MVHWHYISYQVLRNFLLWSEPVEVVEVVEMALTSEKHFVLNKENRKPYYNSVTDINVYSSVI
jgi:hypothetical protein